MKKNNFNSEKVGKTIERVSYYRKPEDMPHEEWQTKLRRQFALDQDYIFNNTGHHPIFSDFELTNPLSKRTYKVAIRSEEPGLNYCSCPDFKINTLGTCKHIEHVLFKLKQSKENQRAFRDGFLRQYSSITLKYGAERKVILRIGTVETVKISELSKKYFDENLILKQEAFDHFETFLNEVVCLDPDFKCYQDAMDYIVEVRDSHKRKQLVNEAFPDGIDSKSFDSLLKTNLYSYQKEGILFAAAAGRSLIADEMGLGKTIQAIGAMEVMFKLFRIERVLIICPTSLKYQWKSEIEKFSDHQALVVSGGYLKRKKQYEENTAIKIVTYNSIVKDLADIHLLAPDLIILDEAQRIKNWKTKLAKAIKSVNSQYSIVLTGTPLENRLDELHSIVEYIDKFKLGPLFKFLANHQLVEPGQTRVIGYHGLNTINKTLSPILIRRNKKQVKMQLPEKLEKTFFVPMTKEQMTVHEECREAVAKLIYKWRKFHFLSDKDRLQLLKQLGIMKMVCDSTYIINQDDRHDTKVDELMTYLKDVLETEDKVIVFSQYERMTSLVAKELETAKIGYEYLHGGIPGDKREKLIKKFCEKPEVRVFLSTDAGGVGLNLQCANVIVNLDCPWNPAVLEQRIARVHRLGQTKLVNVANFISKGTIEEKILDLLRYKKSIFAGVLDHGEDQVLLDDSRLKQVMDSIDDVIATAPEPFIESVNIEPSGFEPVEEMVSTDANNEIGSTGNSAERDAKNIQTMKSNETGEQVPVADNDILSGLIKTSISFLQNLNQGMTAKNIENKVSSFVEKDSVTGKPFLKIPVPDEKILNQAAGMFEQFLKLLKK